MKQRSEVRESMVRQDRNQFMNRKIICLALCALLFALCAVCRGAAANENPADRISNWCRPSVSVGPHRGIPAGSARAWLRGGEKHCHRVAICRGKPDRLAGARGRASASQGRRHRHGGSAATRRRQGSNLYDSHCHGAGCRSCWKRVRRQPCATRRKHYWIVNPCPELSGKRLELLKEIVPKLSRVAVLGTSTSPGNAQI